MDNCKITLIAVIFGVTCFLFVSCGHTENGLYEDMPERENRVFAISLENMNPILTQRQIDQSYWNRTSLNDEQLNSLEGAYLSNVNLSQSNLLSLQIDNATRSTLYRPFFLRPPNVILEKSIGDNWYEVPYFWVAPASRRPQSIATLPIGAGESTAFLPVDLNYWRPIAGLYRILVKVSLYSDFSCQYLLSENFEITNQSSSFAEENFLAFVDYDYAEDILRGVVTNQSETIISLGWLQRLEKYIDGYWYEIPVNSIAPSGGQWQGGLFADSVTDTVKLYYGQEVEISVRLRYWHPLSVGMYRLVMILFIEDSSSSRDESEIFPISAMFKIVG